MKFEVVGWCTITYDLLHIRYCVVLMTAMQRLWLNCYSDYITATSVWVNHTRVLSIYTLISLVKFCHYILSLQESLEVDKTGL